MKKIILQLLIAVALFSSCKKGNDVNLMNERMELDQIAKNLDGVVYRDADVTFQIEKSMISAAVSENGLVKDVIYLGNDQGYDEKSLTSKNKMSGDILFLKGGVCILYDNEGGKMIFEVKNTASDFIKENLNTKYLDNAVVFKGSFLGRTQNLNLSNASIEKFQSLSEGIDKSFKQQQFGNTVMDLPAEPTGPACLSGGVGSISCSFEGEVIIAGSGVAIKCDVVCASGYYSCCGGFTTTPFCRCIKFVVVDPS